MNKTSQIVSEVVGRNDFRIYHSQPLSRSYSTIAKAHRLVSVSQVQLAFIRAVVKEMK